MQVAAGKTVETLKKDFAGGIDQNKMNLAAVSRLIFFHLLGVLNGRMRRKTESLDTELTRPFCRQCQDAQRLPLRLRRLWSWSDFRHGDPVPGRSRSSSVRSLSRKRKL